MLSRYTTLTNILVSATAILSFPSLNVLAQNGLTYTPITSSITEVLSVPVENPVVSFESRSFLLSNKPFLVQEFLTEKDTSKWKAHQFKQAIFSPTGAPPAVERLVVGAPLSTEDSTELQNQKRFSYHLFADFVSYISGQPVEYLQKIEEIADEEALMVSEDLFFDHQDSTIELLENIEIGTSFIASPSDELVAVRMKAIENIVPFTYTPEVRNFIERYGIKHQAYTAQLIEKSYEYFPLFEKILAAHDMPEELKYLVVVESAFKTQVRSRAGAVGLWQFMPRTGQIFGLSQNFYIDERMDPTASTVAACKYLKYLYGIFGDWELAIAAYNCGPGNIKKAMRRSGKEKFWDIYKYLPRETRAYVPLYVAYAYLFNYAEEHGMVVEEPLPSIEYDTVYVSQYVNLDKLADELRMCAADLKAMNPEIKRGIVPRFAKEHPIRIPKNRASYFWSRQEEILLACQDANYRSKAVASSSRSYQPKYETKTVSVNNTAQSYQRTTSVASRTSSYAGSKSYHIVRRGETLSHIAERYGVSVRSLQRWNGLSSARINIGQKLVMYNAKKATSTITTVAQNTSSNSTNATSDSYYVVKQGDTLWRIAIARGTTVTKIKQLNNLRSDKLNVGQRLRVM